MGAVKLLGVILATVCSNYEGAGSVPIMNLKEVKVAVGAALQIKERKGNTKNLKTRKTEFKDNRQSATCEILSHPLMSRFPSYVLLPVLVLEHTQASAEPMDSPMD